MRDGERLPSAAPGKVLDLQRHRTLGREPNRVAGQVRVAEFLCDSARGVIMSLAVVVFLGSGGLCKPNPNRRRDGFRYD